jgi:uncharacterized protein YndB with AHSA1/START domain
MTAVKQKSQEPESFELLIHRTFGAPAARVFKAWTEREFLMRWMCPEGFKVIFFDIDAKAGGAWRSCMQDGEGNKYVHFGVFREIKSPERLVFTHGWEQNHLEKERHETVITVTFKAEGNKTHMTFRHSGLPSAEARDSHHGGWSGAFQHLAEVLSSK